MFSFTVPSQNCVVSVQFTLTAVEKKISKILLLPINHEMFLPFSYLNDISTFLNLYSRVRYKVVCSHHYLLARLNYFTLLWRCIAVCVNGVLFFWNSKSPEYGGVWIWVHVVITRFLLSFSPPRYSHLICHRFSSRVQSAYSSVNIIWITFYFSFTVWILQGE